MPVFINRIILLCLLWLLVAAMPCAAQDTATEERRITSLLDKIKNEKRFVEELTENNLTNLPVGIRKTVSNTTITIAVDSGLLTPHGMMINAYTQIILPGTTRVITFVLKGAVITPAGLSQEGPTRLEVISDFKIPLNSQVTLHIPANNRNFIDWDCTGFRSVNLSGEFEFSPEIFLPDTPSKSARVTAGFDVNTSDLNNILVATSITPFRIKGLNDMSFTVVDAVADMSDLVNCEGFAMPKNYRPLFPDAPQLWRGFFLKNLIIKLPSELGNGKRTEIRATDILIDDFGVSGRFSAKNIIALDQGSASGWPFSINSIEIGLIQNRLAAGELKGMLGIPFLGDEPFGYDAQVVSGRDGLDYSFAVKTSADQEYDVPFGGKVRLNKGCIFNLDVVDGKFIPSAMLNGAMYISGESATLNGLRFEKLQLIAESPYIKGGKFDTSGGAGFNIAGFGLSVDSISLRLRSGKASLALNTKVALMNKTDKGVSASTRMFINASVKKEQDPSGNDRLKWSYDGILLEGVKIKGGVSLFSLKGSVFIYRNHTVYGDGFTGEVGFTAGKIIKDTIQAEIRFGNKTDFRYWYAHIDIPARIPLGAVTLSNLGGGAYSNMERTSLYTVPSEYIPKKDAGLGLLADVGMFVKDEKIFNADVELEIAVNKSGGVKFIRFGGEGRFLAEEGAKTSISNMTASVNMLFDNVNNSFHANLRVFMNVANAIRGRGPGDLLGEAVIHSDPADWYIFIGRPSSQLGVNVAGLLQAQTYFMAGTRIENMPLPPPEVAAIITNTDLDFMKNERDFASGKGIAFGILLKASAGVGKDGGFVYAYFNAGAGADIMLQNYGEARCEGRDGPIGINGWYASGQGYAYLSGKIGIRVKKSEFDIMSVAAALLLQAKMPNPSWFRGNIAARYSILGGLVKGKVNVEVVLGEECVLINPGNELGGIKLIGDLSPAAGSSEVDVFAAPQVSFNTTIDKEFTMMNLNDAVTSYRVILDQFDLKTSSNQVLTGDFGWNPAHDMATLVLRDILPGRQQITATVRVHIEKKTTAGWQPVENGSETSAISFTTGDEPKSVPASNVAYSYPLTKQYNFYRSEYPQGYIKLQRGQPELFLPEKDGIKWSYYARFRSSKQTVDVPVTYNTGGSMIQYEIPASLSASTVYDVVILKKPVSAGSADQNLARGVLEIANVNPLDSTRVTTTDITSAGIAETETELHSLSFRTSMYSTFGEKMNNISGWKDLSDVDDEAEVKTRMHLLYVKGSLVESFDKYEIEGMGNVRPVVRIEADKGTPWIDNHVFPLIYEYYGTGGLTLKRNTDVLGIFPSRAIYVANSKNDSYLLDGSAYQARPDDFYVKYFLPVYINNDFHELLNEATRKYLDSGESPPLQAQRLMSGTLSDISRGSYPFTIKYMLPGKDIATTIKNYQIIY